MRASPALLLASLLAVACAPSRPVPSRPLPPGLHGGGERGPGPGSAGQPRAPSGAPRGDSLPWQDFGKPAFDRARKEGRFVLLDGAAEWCHWCHVMEATTYHDDRVRALLASRFVATKVDIDARPDIAERYADYGWPATVLFSPEGEELGAFRGYLPPDRLLAVLEELVAGGAKNAAAASRIAVPREGSGALTDGELASLEATMEARLAGFYDPREGGWGTFQKAPLGWNNAHLLRQAQRGNGDARARALFTLEKQAALLDPVWGGIYQYSEGATWQTPHFEKLMTFQAPALENYAEAWALTRDRRHLERAEALFSYMEGFLRAGGVFGATQDADLNAHEPGKPYMTGHEYYALGDRERRALGVPRVDAHDYPRENGLGIAAYVTFHEATGDARALAGAREAAARVIATHANASGGLSHDARKDAPVVFLADNAVFGFGLLRLHSITKDPALLEAAEGIASRLLKDLWDPAHGGFYAQSRDPDAVGVFQRRRMPLDENAWAVRFFARLARLTGNARYTTALAWTLRAVMTPENIEDRGRMLGEVLLALGDARGVRAAP